MRHAYLLSILALVVGCGDTIPVGGDGDGSNKKDDSTDSDKNSLDPTVSESPHYARCALVCKTPKDGPCAGEEVNECIEECTTALDGANSACAQCVVEKSGYTGMQCEKVGQRGYPHAFNTAKTSAVPQEGEECPSSDPDCVPICEAEDESCTGFKLASTSEGTCASACADMGDSSSGSKKTPKPPQSSGDAKASCEHMNEVCSQHQSCSGADAEYEALSATDKAKADVQIACVLEAGDCDSILDCLK